MPPSAYTAPALRYWRYHRFVTRAELARNAGVEWHTIDRLEAGGTARSHASIERLATALHLQPTTLQRPLSEPQRQFVAEEALHWAYNEHRGRIS